MQGKKRFFVILFSVVITFATSGAMAGVEPSPFDGLLPILKDFRAEIAKANKKLERFDLSKKQDLLRVTLTSVSIPAMQDLAKDMSSKAGIIGDCGAKTEIEDKSSKAGIIGDCGAKIEIEAHIQSLNEILATQINNRKDKESAGKALSKMTNVLNQMEALIKKARKPSQVR